MVDCKILQLQSRLYSYMTMDDSKIDCGDNGGVLKLEISRISADSHSLKMWHSCVDDVQNSVVLNGKNVATGVKCPTRVK
ncbi:MAG: hypothetical protein NC177_12910 [Ruminococcus flavefaciens]|nr:hypothetical protein [Ruminococcus flavefaciens]